MAQYLLSSSCKSETLVVNNNTPLGAIFNDANVGKKLSAAYWDLVEYGDKEDGPLAGIENHRRRILPFVVAQTTVDDLNPQICAL